MMLNRSYIKFTSILFLLFFACCNSLDIKMSHRYNRVNKDNKKYGVWLEYFQEGKLKNCESYKNGKLNGICIKYFENGKVERVANYSNGELDGIVKVYNDHGFLMQKAKYSKGVSVYVRLMNPY